jgi:hypothetical protein
MLRAFKHFLVTLATLSVLSVHVARFTTLQAIIKSVVAKPHVVPALAHATVPVALALAFFLLAHNAFERFCHMPLDRCDWPPVPIG